MEKLAGNVQHTNIDQMNSSGFLKKFVDGRMRQQVVVETNKRYYKMRSNGGYRLSGKKLALVRSAVIDEPEHQHGLIYKYK